MFIYQAIKLKDKKEKQGFKRSRNLEKKLQDPEKTPQPMVSFTPFAAVTEEREEREERPQVGFNIHLINIPLSIKKTITL